MNWKLNWIEGPFQSRQIAIKITFDPKTIYTRRSIITKTENWDWAIGNQRELREKSQLWGLNRWGQSSLSDRQLFWFIAILFAHIPPVCVSTYSRSTVSSGECLRLFYCSISYQRSSKQATQGEQTLRPRTALGLGPVLGSGDIIISLDKLCLCFVLALPGCQSAVQRINLN